jgi:MSHA biogenesis protein MshI
MFQRLQTKKNRPGWLAIAGDEHAVRYVHCVRPANERPQIVSAAQVDGPSGSAWQRLSRNRTLRGFQYTTVLEIAEYQLFTVDGLNVPQTEIRQALRWRVKDMLDYDVEEARLDALPIPAPGRDLIYAVAARKQAVRDCMERFRKAGLALRVIDIAETSQRNVAALCESSARAVAMLYLFRESGLLTITHRGELMMTRRLDCGCDAVLGAAPDAERAVQGLALELQRTFDHFDRQFSGLPIEKLVLAPLPEAPTALAGRLSGVLGIDTAELDLKNVLQVGADLDSKQRQWEFFHLVGAALRDEGASA